MVALLRWLRACNRPAAKEAWTGRVGPASGEMDIYFLP